MSVKLLTDHHLALLSLKGGWTGSSESSLVKIPHCWKSHVAAHFLHVSLIKNTYVIKGGVSQAIIRLIEIAAALER